jgi:AhpD family alkylhydroperoxidase
MESPPHPLYPASQKDNHSLETHMTTLQVHTIDSAPERSRALLRRLESSVGMVPSLAAAMAESPALLEGFLAVREIYHRASFTPAEIEVLSLTSAYENGCTWCMAFHSAIATMKGVPADVIQALREGGRPDHPRLGPLSEFAREMVRTRGEVSQDVHDRLLAAGFTRAQTLEVVLGMAFSLMANYAGHLANAPLDAPFQAHAWQRN